MVGEDSISFDANGKVKAAKANFVGMSSGDFLKLDFLQANSVLGLGPIRKDRPEIKQFVSAIAESS